MPDEPRAPTQLERPLIRIALAAVLLVVLGGPIFLLATRDGDDDLIDIGEAPARTGTPVSEVGIGPLDDRPPLIGRPAPDFTLRDTEGTPVTLSDLRGKVVWINFWATWCNPCRKELPDIQRLYNEKRAEGLEVFAINWQDGRDDAAEFFADRELTIPVLLDGDGAVYDQYRLQGLPDSFFIDRGGNIAAVQYGALSEEKMRERLEQAGLP